MKKYYHIVLDEVYEFDGTNQEEIKNGTKKRVVPTNYSDVMAIPVDDSVILVEKGRFIVLNSDGIKVVTKEQLDSVFVEMPENLEKEETKEPEVKDAATELTEAVEKSTTGDRGKSKKSK